MSDLTVSEVAQRVDVSGATLRRWVKDGIVPLGNGRWTPAAAVNLAARVGARAAGGEVLVTDPVVAAAGDHLAFEAIGEVKLKGFSEATELFLASARP